MKHNEKRKVVKSNPLTQFLKDSGLSLKEFQQYNALENVLKEEANIDLTIRI